MRRVSQAWCRPHPELTSLQHQACAILPSSPKVLAPFTLQFHLEHARAENPANPPLIGANILCSLPRTFNLAQESIQAYGKSLLIEIPRQALGVGVTFLQIQFYLPRHMLVIAETELLEIEHYWSQWSDKLRSRVTHTSHCAYDCAVVNHPSSSLITTNRYDTWPSITSSLSACGSLPLVGPILSWLGLLFVTESSPTGQGLLCPSFFTSDRVQPLIILYTSQNVFCGLGASIIIEVLHMQTHRFILSPKPT